MNRHLKQICENIEPIYTEKGEWMSPNFHRKKGYWSINLSSIETKLIQEVGRFAEFYASDFLITWAHMQELLKTPLPKIREHEKQGVLIIAIRKSGVDGEGYLLSRTDPKSCNHQTGYVAEYYRSAYAVTWNIKDNNLTVELKDIHGFLYKLCQREKDETLEIADGTYTFSNCDSNGNLQACVVHDNGQYSILTKSADGYHLEKHADKETYKKFGTDVIDETFFTL